MAAKNGVAANFDVGYFVLWSRIDQRLPNNTLLGQWVGPFQVVAERAHSFQIRHLVTGAEYEAHATRLKYYVDSALSVTEEILEFVAGQGMIMTVKYITVHQYNDTLQRWNLKVSWTGQQSIEDSWESVDELLKDVPVLVREYVEKSSSDLLRA
ncbi:hypothetical protein L914_16107 [Phytophthora nicotianae]|uniref:Chromo domain-containing protein n=2 Tax=Phytophthora nicotianae TaxID=4792 RepID=W2MPE3_PHYNI|nr:hypothetical protein L914_16107 [Phytophthora nicotianae]